MWLLGDHRVLCASVLDIMNLESLMGLKRASMVFSDPVLPMAPTSAGSFLARCLRNQAAFCCGGTLLYLCADWHYMADILATGREADMELRDLCVWAQDRPGPGSLYRSQHQLVFVFSTTDAPQQHLPGGRSVSKRSNLWRYPSAKSARDLRTKHRSVQHGRAKPVALVADAILDSTRPGEIVLDGLLSNGTTLIAAHRTGRRCFGIEADPRNVDATIRRWQKLTGGIARDVTGRAFEDLATEVADAE
jgi:DNA modification methylase